MSSRYVEIKNLRKYFPIKSGFLQRGVGYVHAVDDVSIDMERGETIGLVGESGCGKTTTGKCILRLLEPTAGDIIIDGGNVTKMSRSELRRMRKDMQMIFQDPFASLNPLMKVRDIVGRPLEIHDVARGLEREKKVIDTLTRVGLSSEHIDRYPHEFSGGQRQRIAIARCLVLNPRFLVLDEPTSALDVSVRSQILNLLKELQTEFGLTYVYVSHDLATVRHMSDRIYVMYLGKIVEAGFRELFTSPLHPYTQALFSAIPIPNPKIKRRRIILPGDVPSPVNPPHGCRLHPRCPYVTEICRSEEPELLDVGSGHLVACHRAYQESKQS